MTIRQPPFFTHQSFMDRAGIDNLVLQIGYFPAIHIFDVDLEGVEPSASSLQMRYSNRVNFRPSSELLRFTAIVLGEAEA